MSWFTLNRGNTPDERSEQKAVVVALFASLLCVGVFVSISHRFPSSQAARKAVVKNPTAENLLKVPADRVPQAVDFNARYKAVPSTFLNTDFYNRSYGIYKHPDLTTDELRLERGGYFLPDRKGWFEIKDVYYVDVTGDGADEALVRMTHFDCLDGNCDGGSSLFYIYTLRNGRLKQLWQFESGTYAYGCGLKSLTVNGKELVVEMFGEGCHNPRSKSQRYEYIAEHRTFLYFQFDGQGFLQRPGEFAVMPAANVRDYEPEIRIFGAEPAVPPSPFAREIPNR
jgi:hypothetical protein